MTRDSIAWLVCAVLTGPTVATIPSDLAGDEPGEPVVIVQEPPVGILQRPDGSFAFYNLERGTVTSGDVVRHTLAGEPVRFDPPLDFALPAGTTRGRLLLDAAGELHDVYLEGRPENGRHVAVDRFIDLWHRRTTDGGRRWQQPRRVWDGYCGALMHFAQLPSGRIIAPFGEWVANRRTGPPTGANVVTAMFSDDDGDTWRQSPARLTSPCRADYNGSNYGACEPVVIKLADGRLWMLMRTQTGFLYESVSDDDGYTWREARPSRFHASTGPPGLTRLADGRIVLFWNNCQMPPKVDGAGVYGGRDALHAAISDDEGATWHGFREVYRDPYRNDTPPKSGDRGTAYPFGAYDDRGRILLVSGQGRGRRNFVRFDPEWLTAISQSDDFSNGLDGWHVFKPFGPAARYWRDRAVGPVLTAHPDIEGKHVLHVRRLDDKPADGATWNFPSGRSGRLVMRMMCRDGFDGASIALGDRMFEPTDDAGERLAMFRALIDSEGRVDAGHSLALGSWHTLTLTWDLDASTCSLLTDGWHVDLPLQHTSTNGICYLRLRSTADAVDQAGFLVDRVEAVVD